MVRIIAGTLKGRRMVVPQGARVRPTADRVREALFSILGEKVEGARVLDAFAGTGAMGFEALSRGAASVTFVELDGIVARALDQTVNSLDLQTRTRVLRGEASDWVRRRRIRGPFDLIFADPPYEADERQKFLGALKESSTLAADGILVVEAPLRSPAPGNSAFELYRTANYGAVSLHFLALVHRDG